MSQFQSDYQHRGLSKEALLKLILSASENYSGRWNSRNLEHPFYGYWSIIFHDFIRDPGLSPYSEVKPQYQLATTPEGEPLVTTATSSQEEGQTQVLDNENKSSNEISISIVTTPRRKTKEITPDFSIVIHGLRNSNLTNKLSTAKYDSWPEFKVNLKISLLAELKRPGSRCAKTISLFLETLDARMKAAMDDLVKQAEHAFKTQAHDGIEQRLTQKMVLMACCGEWWAWMIATPEVRSTIISIRQEPYDDDDDDGNEPEREDEDEDLEDQMTSTSSSEWDAEVDTTSLEPRILLPRVAKTNAAGKYADEAPITGSIADMKVSYKKPTIRKPKQRATSKKGKNRVGNVQDTVPPQPRPAKMAFKRYTDLGDHMETLKEDSSEIWPSENEWTRYMLFGSEVSNQQLYFVIPKIMKKLSDELTGGGKGEGMGEPDPTPEDEVVDDMYL